MGGGGAAEISPTLGRSCLSLSVIGVTPKPGISSVFDAYYLLIFPGISRIAFGTCDSLRFLCIKLYY